MRFGAWLLCLVAVGALVLSISSAAAMPGARQVEPQNVEVSSVVASKISYQGKLTSVDGVALQGTHQMRFQLFDQAVGGSMLWDSGLLSVEVDRGLLDVLLDVSPTAFDGKALWLAIAVEGEWLAPRQELTAVPYALSLRPGALVSSTPTDWEGWVLKVNMEGAYPLASGVYSLTATGAAIRGESAGGYGILGYTQDGYAVYGQDTGTTNARGYGGYFTSSNGIGVYGYSGAARTASNNDAPGVYGRSAQGVGVLGYGSTKPGGKFTSYGGNSIEGWEDALGNGVPTYLRFKVSNGGNVYADGTYYGAGGVSAGSADFAEMMSPGESNLEPGDVLAIGLGGQMVRSSQPFQSSVAGIYSTEPGFIAGNKLDEEGNSLESDNIPLAVVGVVPAKATAENGTIRAGDLLTTSSTPGHAMKAGANPPVGTVLGKALQPLDGGTGTIKILVTLQ